MIWPLQIWNWPFCMRGRAVCGDELSHLHELLTVSLLGVNGTRVGNNVVVQVTWRNYEGLVVTFTDNRQTLNSQIDLAAAGHRQQTRRFALGAGG